MRRLFRGAEGVAAVLGPEDFARYHLPRPGDHPGMADLILAALDGYAIGGEATGDTLAVPGEGTTGSHGYLSTDPQMNAVFVASGAGIKPGAKLDAVENTSVAPTVAAPSWASRRTGPPAGPSRRSSTRAIEAPDAPPEADGTAAGP